MRIAIGWRFAISLNVNIRLWFDAVGSAIHELIGTLAANRTTAKFLFACGKLLITITVMLARAI